MSRSWQEQSFDLLRACGKRVTAQRRLVLEIVAGSEGHLDAGEIYRRARTRDPRISLSTVYRNLNLLQELGIISELHLDEEHHHYEVKQASGHHHLICSRCDSVVEFDSPLADRLISEVAEQEGFSIERAHIDLVGVCGECRSKESS
jgi:Fur family ferric uptake transcriptional regulator